MNEPIETAPFMLNRRSPAETRAYRQGVHDAFVICLDIMRSAPDNAREKILLLLQLHKSTPPADAETA